ncbi:Vps54-domain-containing protein [Aulographum hederae CBS 113979]|uniref:Vacuolar protein sorting-associated protein 54 n=1 Tax=Aulographum hederae CBS 113979 TaxID=1176131 RepID=A0A6G1H0B8_9PEZI|nr:Vps54-domain-containing protein [Aulographum hederae CBS 113979]
MNIAISTLLQPPIVRTGLLPHTTGPTSQKPPSTKDIPPVTLTNIPHVEPSAFKEYLTQVGSLFEAFQRSKAESEDDNTSQLFRRDRKGSKDDEYGELIERGLRNRESRESGLCSPSVASISSAAGGPPTMRRRSSGGIGKRNTVTPLSTIPSVYFEENFALENPRTFDVVSERSEVVRPHPSVVAEEAKSNDMNGSAAPARKALATNAILQEKLSWYMDTVEIHLISSISSASTSFFAALGSLRELQSEAAESVEKIKKLREDLQDLDKAMALGGLEIIAMKRRRENLRKLSQAVDQLRHIVEGATHCEELVESGELDLAIDRLDQLEELAAGTLNPFAEDVRWLLPEPMQELIDLRRLKAIEGLSQGIDQLRLRVGQGYEARFLDVLLGDLRQHVSAVPNRDTLQRWAAASTRGKPGHVRAPSKPPAYISTSDKLRADLLAILNNLNRSKHTVSATGAYREAIMREMKSLIRKHLPSSSDDDNESVASTSTRASRALSQQDKSSILARNLRSLDPDMAEELLFKVYCGVGEALRRLGIQVKVLLDVTSSISTPSPMPRSPPKSPTFASIDRNLSKPVATLSSGPNLQEELTQALDMSSLLGQAVDVAQTQITKILRVRSEQAVRLPLPMFLRYFTVNRLFADECEAVSGRSGASLRGIVNGQIHDFVSLLADAEKEKLAHDMEVDRWEARDFTERDSELLARVTQGMTSDPPAWSKASHVWEEVQVLPAPSADTNGTRKKEPRCAVIEEEIFILVESAICLLRGLETLETLVANIPTTSSDVSSAILEYLKIFNSRSYQLILGAGATRTANLKNINTKHLALASQALGFVITLIPYIREFVRRRPSSNSAALAEYDRVKRLLQDHQESIHTKLADIMNGRANIHTTAMGKVDWDKDTQREVSAHIETITKETVTLHRVLAKHLPPGTLGLILAEVFTSYREQWGKAFEEAEVRTEEGKKRLLRDAEFFDARIGKIDGGGDVGRALIDIVKAKKIAGAPGPTTTAAPASDDTPQKIDADSKGDSDVRTSEKEKE